MNFNLISIFSIIYFMGADAVVEEVWIAANTNVKLPSNAVQAGVEGKAWRVYVGKYLHPYEDWIAVKLVYKVNMTECHYAYYGQEHSCSEFHYLVGNSEEYQWVQSFLGEIPSCGIRTNGVFGVGRAQISGDTVVGKIVPLEQAMFGSHFAKEYRLKSYESLTRRNCYDKRALLNVHP